MVHKDEHPVVVVAGHICLDVIPAFSRHNGVGDLLVPGKLVDVGAAVLATGGAVANTGLALHKLGVSTRLMGKVGDDLFGRAILAIVRDCDPALADEMIVGAEENSSYTIVINPPDIDRIFLHCPGANDTFCAEDVKVDQLEGVHLFHFGYPPLMRRMYADEGLELATLLRRVKESGIITSLDMAKPDPQSDAGQADWAQILQRALPYVDVFIPSWEEILFMMRRDLLQSHPFGAEDLFLHNGETMLSEIAEQLLAWGAAVVGIKLGDQGLYLRTTSDSARFAKMNSGYSADMASWVGRELLAPCFAAEVKGTTGAGDCTVAGLLTGLLHGQEPEDALTSAVAVGACNVEAADATSGVPSWQAVQQRIAAGWSRRSVEMNLTGWMWNERKQVWIGTHDIIRF